MKTLLLHLLLAFVLLGATASAPAPEGRVWPHLNRLLLRPPPPPVRKAGIRAPVEKWFDQELDHFHPTNTKRWQQKYYSNDQFFTTGGPLFVMIGGEGPASPGWLQGGHMMEMAQQHGAATFYLEHRFYGDSRPTPDVSVESLQYLSAEQALADLGQFLQSLQRISEYREARVVVFGGSYAGNLAAWARLKYPHLVDAAVASSAPVQAAVAFPEYYDAVARAMRDSNSACLTDIQTATDTITDILANPGGAETISQMFNLCAPMNLTNSQDVGNFYSSFAGLYAGVVQYAPNLEYVGQYCSLMTDPWYGETPLDRYIYLAKTYITGGGCMEIRHDLMSDYYGNTEWDSDAAVSSGRQWLYQTCTEYGYYQTSTARLQPFGDFFDIFYYFAFCTDFYDESFTPSFIAKAADRTNMLFGGTEIEVDKVVFVHGSIDPWRILGILSDISDDAPVVMIDGVAHCADMSSSSGDDSFQLTQGKNKIAQLIDQWLA